MASASRARIFVVLPLLLGACDESSGANPSGFLVPGSSIGDNIPERGTAVVVWAVESVNPNYAYKLGEAEATQGQFTIGFATQPPAAALNNFSSDIAVGIGFVLLLRPGVSLPDGRLSEMTAQNLESMYVGISTQHAIIWRKGEIPCSGDPQCSIWWNRMPTGFSCGRCVPAKPGESFDTYEKVDCGELRIQTAKDPAALLGCNWT